MKRTDVRIGNYIEVENLKTGHKEVAPVNQMMLINWNEGETYRYNPIELTEDWLERLGVTNMSAILHNYGEFYVRLSTYELGIGGIDSTISAQMFYAPCKFVHQLQNLYVALTEQELTADL